MGPLPVLEDGLCNSKSRVDGSSSVPVNVSESPEVEADAWEAPGTQVRHLSFLASNEKDEKDEDEGTHDFHIARLPDLVLRFVSNTAFESIKHGNGCSRLTLYICESCSRREVRSTFCIRIEIFLFERKDTGGEFCWKEQRRLKEDDPLAFRLNAECEASQEHADDSTANLSYEIH